MTRVRLTMPKERAYTVSGSFYICYLKQFKVFHISLISFCGRGSTKLGHTNPYETGTASSHLGLLRVVTLVSKNEVIGSQGEQIWPIHKKRTAQGSENQSQSSQGLSATSGTVPQSVPGPHVSAGPGRSIGPLHAG